MCWHESITACWFTGGLVCWRGGTLGYRRTSTMARWRAVAQVSRYAVTLVCGHVDKADITSRGGEALARPPASAPVCQHTAMLPDGVVLPLQQSMKRPAD